ncbi:hypothetical protein L6164_021248 [Bauhinia variegata]|uniref:Uncharacterized protein n=1 Tax=Bauhinia variegata TaxID=167791 RepID=A0ACB9MXY1_BAUVA|nr:hypothetical protein L6164_021248 [Bauhinia variegata]
MENNCGFISCDKLDRVATWVGSNVASAFFASMERCSCINLSTTDNDEDEEAHDFPLILSRTTSHIGSQSEAENNDSGIWRLDMGVHAGIGLVPLEFSSLAQRKLQRRETTRGGITYLHVFSSISASICNAGLCTALHVSPSKLFPLKL